jgi:hypothetical protein
MPRISRVTAAAFREFLRPLLLLPLAPAPGHLPSLLLLFTPAPLTPSPSSFDQPLYLADPPPPPHHANTSGQYSTDYFTARYQWHSGAKQPALGFQALGVVHWQEPPGRSNVPTEALGKHASGIGAAFVLGRCSMVHNALGVARRLFRYRCQGKSQACLGSTCWHRRTLSAQLASHRATLQLVRSSPRIAIVSRSTFSNSSSSSDRPRERERERERAEFVCSTTGLEENIDRDHYHCCCYYCCWFVESCNTTQTPIQTEYSP